MAGWKTRLFQRGRKAEVAPGARAPGRDNSEKSGHLGQFFRRFRNKMPFSLFFQKKGLQKGLFSG